MVKRYGSKRDKAIATKGWAAKEGRSVWETERVMDVELFLKGQAKWEEDSPHCLVLLYKMLNMLQTKGRKRQSKHSVKAADRGYKSWTLRWSYLPFSW